MPPGPSPEPLGDFTERVLRSFGITQERYCEAKRRFGLCPECWCEERKAWLNKVSDWIKTFTAQRRG